MGRLYMVRHGETEWNALGRIQGHTDVGLSDQGREQARAVARRLSGVAFDAAYSSDLSRTRETAQIILGESPASLNSTERIREYKKGVFEGLTPDESMRRYPELYEASLVNDLDFAPTGGETIRQTSLRMANFVSDLKKLHQDETVLMVGHGGSLRSAVVAIMDLPLEANWKLIMGNCSLSIFDTYTDNAVMLLYNDTSHLNGVNNYEVYQ